MREPKRDGERPGRVGLVGIGRMGGLMLRCLRRHGFEAAVFDVREEALAAFAGDGGVHPVSDPRQVAEFADVVGVVVFDDAQVLEVLEGEGGILAAEGDPPVILVHSTVTAAGLRRAHAAAAERGFPLLDAAVSGGTSEQQEAGDLCVMVGGDPAALERARPVLQTYAGLIEHVGSLGSGLDAKLVRNLASFASVASAYQAFELGHWLGIDAETVSRILEHTQVVSGNTRAIVAARPPGQAIDAQGDPQLAEQVRYLGEVARKDLEAARARAAEVDRDLPLAEASLETLARAYGGPRRS
ncbi:MAG: NAD(P)-dependent oxidoreductase [Proteobacteria bacterium]|nr:NAD(P)-dependent oxidoreductase [Pseudomonadota bacterium]